MEKINKLIVLLLVIANYSKDIHYNAKGSAFYSEHLLADRVSENIYDYIDSIKEVFFLAADKEPLASKEYLKKASELIPDIKDSFKSLSKLLVDALKHIETLKDLTKGEENLIGNIAENLQTSAGLINRQIK